MTQHQQYILDFARAMGGQFTKAELLASGADFWYHSNSGYHVGMVLTRMVRNGMLSRIKRRTYKLGSGNHPKNQLSIFTNKNEKGNE